MEFNEQNYKECLESLGFTEQANEQFGGFVVYDDRSRPFWTYQTEEEKQELYTFLSGAVYWKIHTTPTT